MVVACAYCLAQDRNNEDEVVKIDWFNQHATKEGELIVKFADHTTLQLKSDERGVLQTTNINKVDALLKQFPVAKAERLCPNDNPSCELKTSKSYNGPDVVERDLSRLCRFVMQDPKQTYEMIDALKALPEVEFAEPNYMAFALGSFSEPLSPLGSGSSISGDDHDTRDGGYFNYNAYMHEPMYPLQWGLQAVKLPQLWAADNNTDTDRKIIAILDTGVDIDHPDLAANIWTNPGENENGYDDDNNGFADDLHGWDFVNQTADIHDFNSHGTHCAGIAAAVGDNGIGMTGANPMAYIMPIAVLQSNGTGDVATIIQGINYAKNNGADVLSMSFGSYSYSIALEQALAQAYQNAVLVAAAGNDGLHIDPRCCPEGPAHAMMDGPMFPAAFTFVFGVEATQQAPGLCGYTTCWSNTDCDGPSFSQYGEEQLYNYELQAPGAAIYSTVPNGNYRNYSGTSMSTPLVAGGISALLHAKPYASQEMLWGDLINTAGNHVNFKACYDMGEAPAQLDFVCFEMNDTINGDSDGRPDAGETICLYPTLRSTWGATDNIMMWLTVDEYEDPDIVTFLDADPVEFGWTLSAYAKSKAANPLRFTIDPDCVDGRTINLVLHLTANPTQYQLNVHFTIKVENGVELGGMITQNMTLYPKVHYIVNSALAIPSNVTLTIKPGTIVKFKDNVGLNCAGNIVAEGTPDSLIVFTKTDLGQGNVTRLDFGTSVIKYALFDGFSFSGQYGYYGSFENCIFKNSFGSYIIYGYNNYHQYYKCNLFNLTGRVGMYNVGSNCFPTVYCNIINNTSGAGHPEYLPRLETLKNSNSFSNYFSGQYISGYCNIGINVFVSDFPSYFGSDSPELLHNRIVDLYNPLFPASSYTMVDLDAILHQPSSEAHGIVWKVVVNGYDA